MALTSTVTESLVRISCGGTSNEIVLKSITRIESVHGSIQNSPGPLTRPFMRPSLITTARSYSFIIFMLINKNKGNVSKPTK